MDVLIYNNTFRNQPVSNDGRCFFIQSAFFSFDSMIIVVLLFICTASYIRSAWPSFVENHKSGFRGIIRSAAVIGDRLSPFVSVLCLGMAVFNLARWLSVLYYNLWKFLASVSANFTTFPVSNLCKAFLRLQSWASSNSTFAQTWSFLEKSGAVDCWLWSSKMNIFW